MTFGIRPENSFTAPVGRRKRLGKLQTAATREQCERRGSFPHVFARSGD